MAGDFDPYYTWLGIRPDEQPADHYRLLGVRQFEDNADAIQCAMDQRMHFLRTLQVGKRAAASQALLNEISAAAGCLLDPVRKAEYDRHLRALAVAQSQPAAALPVVTHSPVALSGDRTSSAWPAANSPVVLAVAALVGLPLLGLAGLAVARMLPAEPSPVTRRTQVTPPQKVAPPQQITPRPAAISPIAVKPLAESPPPALTAVGGDDRVSVPPVVVLTEAADQPPGVIDVLRADPAQLWMIRGSVRRPQGAIETAMESTAFAFPVKFPRAYAIEADVVRQRGTNSLCFGFAVAGRPLTAVVDGFDSKQSGLASVNGQEIFSPNNPLVKSGAVLVNGQPATVRIEVTQQHVDFAVAGQSISRWQVDSRVPIRSARGMSWNEGEALCVFAWDASYLITRLQIVPLSEEQ